MTHWRYPAASTALCAPDDVRANGLIALGPNEWLYGPYIEAPAGRGTAVIRLDRPGRGLANADVSIGRGEHVVARKQVDLASKDTITLSFTLPEQASGIEVRLNAEDGASALIAGVEIVFEADVVAPEADRPVGFESRKTYADKIDSGFIAKYLSGSNILELGYVGYYGSTVPIVPQAVGVDVGYPGYDGRSLPFADESFDAIYSSHCFEHIPDYVQALRDWNRLLKVGGYIIIVVPHQHLFEKRRRLPSRGNVDHKRFYTPESLLREIGEALEENRWRVRHLRENDETFNYDGLPNEPSLGLYEIELVVEKIAGPIWNLDDWTVRAYSASEFDTHLARPDPWIVELDSGSPEGSIIKGPWVGLGKAHYSVEFYFEPPEWDAALDSELLCAVHANDEIVAQTSVSRDMLAEGLVRLDLHQATPSASMEFRVSRSGPALPGRLRFKGVIVRYRSPD